MVHSDITEVKRLETSDIFRVFHISHIILKKEIYVYVYCIHIHMYVYDLNYFCIQCVLLSFHIPK